MNTDDFPTADLDLPAWLDRIERLHPNEIELGLERVRQVAHQLQLERPAPLVITVGGTNGKGSCVAAIEAIARAASLRVGTYTSPHLLHYNERVRINAMPVSDEQLCAAFARIEQARGDISLTYFEFGTLAALLIFQQAQLDIAVLEVGLGGRLDAVNIVDADVAIISSIGLDHQQWLGDTREAIGREKAGIFRAGRPAVCGDPDPPESLQQTAAERPCPLYVQGEHFSWHDKGDTWTWTGVDSNKVELAFDDLPRPHLNLNNMAAVLQALMLSSCILTENDIRKGLRNLELPGRQQCLRDQQGRRIILDVAHNPQAAAALAVTLERVQDGCGENCEPAGKTRLVCAMMADKDVKGFYQALENNVDFWYIAHFDQARCLPAPRLYESLQAMGASISGGPFDSVQQAFVQACAEAGSNDAIVVAGSFFTVSEIMQLLEQSGSRPADR